MVTGENKIPAGLLLLEAVAPIELSGDGLAFPNNPVML
jgi:hypothetical protein